MPLVCVPRFRYLGPSDWSAGGERTLTNQGGYYCSVRARTEFENEGYVLDAPNFWSRYMDTKVGSGERTSSLILWVSGCTEMEGAGQAGVAEG